MNANVSLSADVTTITEVGQIVAECGGPALRSGTNGAMSVFATASRTASVIGAVASVGAMCLTRPKAWSKRTRKHDSGRVCVCVCVCDSVAEVMRSMLP